MADCLNVSCELLVVGAGPAGIAAVVHAAGAGREVVLIDQQRDPGGQIWRGQWQALQANQPLEPLARSLLQQLELAIRSKRVRFLGGCRVVLAPVRNRLRCDGENPADIEFNRLVLACGARELFLPFPGWQLPGVTGAGALQLMVKEGADMTGRRVVIAGSGPLLLAVAATLRSKGAHVVAILEQQSSSQITRFAFEFWRWPELLWQALRLRWQTRDIPYLFGRWITCAEGKQSLETVQWQDQRGAQGQFACDWLACGYGLVPNQEILALLGAHPVAPDSVQTTRSDVYIAGEMSRVGGVRRAVLSGALAAAMALGQEPSAARLSVRLARWQRYAQSLSKRFKLRAPLHALATDDTIFCRCEGVTAGAVRTCTSFREAKLATRLGMGACQGRICGAAAYTLFAWPIQHTRAPLVPTPIATFLSSEDRSEHDSTHDLSNPTPSN